MAVFPNPSIELLLDGVWTDITDDVYTRDGIHITGGAPGEGAAAEASRCNLTINNRSGDYSPRNPTGAHFGVLGRNTQLRIAAGSTFRFVGEVSSWPQKWDPSEKDVWVPIEAAGVMRRLGQGAAALKSTLYRALTTLATPPVAYWPFEDGGDATEFASALPGAPAAIGAAGADLAAFTGFKASSPLPLLTKARIAGQIPGYAHTGEHQTRFLLAVPAAGVVPAEVVICNIYTVTNSASRWELSVKPDGALILRAFNPDGTELMSTGPVAFAVNGKLLRVSVELEQVGADVAWNLLTVEPGASGVSFSGTLTGRSIGRARAIGINGGADLDDVAIGHVSVQSTITSLFDLSLQLNAYIGEPAGTRIQRLCVEEGLSLSAIGALGNTARLGPQLPTTLLDLLREAADADMGILYEPRTTLGLAYRTRASLYAQAPDLALDYAAGHLSAIEPVDDDQATRNDVTVTREGGGSARAELTTGALSTAAPPDGVGRYDEEVSISVQRDEDLAEQASWRLRLGTVDEARYPRLGVNLASLPFLADAGLTADAEALDVGGKITVDNPPAWLPPEAVGQLVLGFTETISPPSGVPYRHPWTIDFNCAPASPWDVGVYDAASGAGEARYSSDGSTLAEVVDTTETAIDVATPVGPLWGAADAPYDLYVGGERMTVTAVTGAASPQTFTVVRSVNGVVKTHAIGTEVRLFKPAIYAL